MTTDKKRKRRIRQLQAATGWSYNPMANLVHRYPDKSDEEIIDLAKSINAIEKGTQEQEVKRRALGIDEEALS